MGRKLAGKWLVSQAEGPLDVELFGGNARLHPVNNHPESKALLSPGHFAPAEFAFCRKHIPQEGGVFLDIGANAGIFSLYLASRMRSGKIIAVEPIPELYNRLTTNLMYMNPDLPGRLDLRLFNFALGAEDGNLTLHIPEQLGQASLRHIDGAKEVAVPIRPMLDMLTQSKASHVDLMKIDVEGFEDSILVPFFQTAPRSLFPRAIVMEHCHARRWLIDCEAFLATQGYKIVRKDRTNLMLTLPH